MTKDELRRLVLDLPIDATQRLVKALDWSFRNNRPTFELNAPVSLMALRRPGKGVHPGNESLLSTFSGGQKFTPSCAVMMAPSDSAIGLMVMLPLDASVVSKFRNVSFRIVEAIDVLDGFSEHLMGVVEDLEETLEEEISAANKIKAEVERREAIETAKLVGSDDWGAF